jgi:hypothetical protein
VDRVYKELRQGEAPAVPDSAVRDCVLRLALVGMALDPTSALTSDQRAWVKALQQRTTPFTAGERARLKAPILTWVGARMPRCLEVVKKQFDA